MRRILTIIAFAAVTTSPVSLTVFTAVATATLWSSAPASAQKLEFRSEICPMTESAVKDLCASVSGAEVILFLKVNPSPQDIRNFRSCGCKNKKISNKEKISKGKVVAQQWYRGLTKLGSHCLQLCASATGGNPYTYPPCVQYCETYMH